MDIVTPSIAFDSMYSLIKAAREKDCDLYILFWQAYSEDSTLFYEDTNLVSSTGIQQGDAFGPTLICLAVNEPTFRVHTEFNVWYLDNGTIGDTSENVYANVEQLVDRFRELGLVINQDTCELIILSHSVKERESTESLFRGLMPEIKVIAASDASLLGHFCLKRVSLLLWRGNVESWIGLYLG